MNNEFSEDTQIKDSHGTGLLIVLAVSIFITYSIYLFYLQVIRGVEYQAKAVKISRQIEKLPAQRGEIYDTNYNLPLVLNIDSFALVVVPAEIEPNMRSTVFAKLATVLEEPLEEINRRIPPSHYKLFQPVEISSTVSQETIINISERIDEFPGVSWYSRPERSYLETGSFSHIIGYVGDISRDELKIYYNKGYQTGTIIGKAGIEKQYDNLLRGKDGLQYKTVDVKGRRVEGVFRDVEPPFMGKNIVLTIDRSIQILSEKALGERIGSIVVMRPATGEILGLVSYPFYNANSIVEKGGNNEYARLLTDSRTPLIQRAIQSSYPPASTFKTIMTAAIIEEKSIPLDEKILCTGEINYGDRVFRCWIRKPGHGKLNLADALAQSCDVYFWEVGRDNLGIERIVSYAREFGFGQITGIDLPGEASGFVPSPQWKERKFHEKWLGGDTLNLAIGQGYLLVTPLQLANMMAMVVNDGIIYKPHILKEVREPGDGSIVKIIGSENLFKSSISKDTFKLTKEYLRGVVEVGTARYPVNTKSVLIGGKTGTAEVGFADRWHSWFVGYGPVDAEDPKDMIVVVSMIEASNPWEWWAPYATNIIFQGIFTGQSYEETAASLGLSGKSITADARVE
jgi:penicillin-binding protein 2